MTGSPFNNHQGGAGVPACDSNHLPLSCPQLISCRRLWDRGAHNALTDLIRFQDRWYCTFRQGELHVGGMDGRVVVLESPDGESWLPVVDIREQGVDLRDPKLSITPSGRLMLLMGGSCFDTKGRFLMRQTRVAFSETGREWSEPDPILTPGEWLWRLTWHEGVAYGLSYNPDKKFKGEKEWHLSLFQTMDGCRYTLIRRLDVPGLPNEATLRFKQDGSMIALIRREREPCTGWIGQSSYPYRSWIFKEIPYRLGGPNFIILDDGTYWTAGRGFVEENDEVVPKTILGRMTDTTYEPLLILPSGGDTSYPGMVFYQGLLWISYYSSHEEKSCIYLAKIQLP